MCASPHCIIHMFYVHKCVCFLSLSVWPFKRFLQGRGEEKITGADIICFCHVDSTSDLTQCGPIQHGRRVDIPAHMLQRDARTRPETWAGAHAHVRLCRGHYTDTHWREVKHKCHCFVILPLLQKFSNKDICICLYCTCIHVATCASARLCRHGSVRSPSF